MDQKPTAQGAGQAELEPRSRGLVLPGPWGPRLPASSWDVRLAPPPAGVTEWGWDSRTGFYGGFFIQKTKKPTVKPHDASFIKICAIVLI